MDREAWHSLRWLALLGAGLAHTGSILASLRADDSRQIEMRTFEVLVEQKPAGEYQLTYEPLDNAITKVTVHAQVKVVILLYTYQYSLRSVELWRQGSLMAYDGAAVDDGTKTNLSAVFAANLPGMTKPRGVTLNGHARPLKENCVWATTYSCLSAPLDRGALPLLDVDNG